VINGERASEIRAFEYLRIVGLIPACHFAQSAPRRRLIESCASCARRSARKGERCKSRRSADAPPLASFPFEVFSPGETKRAPPPSFGPYSLPLSGIASGGWSTSALSLVPCPTGRSSGKVKATSLRGPHFLYYAEPIMPRLLYRAATN
jgi:hypothetical protein